MQDNRTGELKNTVAYRRIFALLDEGSFCEIDPLARSGEDFCEAAAGYGTVAGVPVYVFSQNSDIAHGAMSRAQARKLCKVYELAEKTGNPIVGMFDSNGARLSEGAEMMAAYGDMMKRAARLSGVVPQIALVLGPCIGASALTAAMADLVIVSKDGELRLSEEEKACGAAQLFAEDEGQAIEKAKDLLLFLPSNNLSGSEEVEYEDKECTLTENSRGMDAIEALSDSVTELSPDDGAVSTALCYLAGIPCGMLSYDGMLDRDACVKAARFVRFCDAFSVPVISLIDAEGFSSLREASMLCGVYSETTSAKISVILGKAVGSAYIALAGRGADADVTLSFPTAVVSPIAPAAAALFLSQDRLAGSEDPVSDRKKLIEEYEKNEASPTEAAACGYIEDIVPPDSLRGKLASCLAMLSSKRAYNLPKKHNNIQL